MVSCRVEKLSIVINLNSKIYVAGHNGLVGSAILRNLKKKVTKIL